MDVQLLKLVGPVAALFSEIGGAVFIPVILVASGLGLFFGGSLRIRFKIGLLLFFLLVYFIWSLFFVFSYEYAPGKVHYMISGWRLNPPTEAYLERNPALRQMSRDFVSAELVKNFKSPAHVWNGTDLLLSKAVGGVAMAGIMFSIGMLLALSKKK